MCRTFRIPQSTQAVTQPIPVASATAFSPRRADSSRFFAEVGLTPNTQFTTVDIQATYAMVGAGLGVTVTNRINSNRQDTDVRHLPLDPPKEIELGLACARDLPPAAEAFLAFIRDQLPRGVE